MKRTLQEFADLFGVYTAQMSHGRRVAYENKPKIDRHIDICNEMLLETWFYTGESTCIDMFTEPFPGDWKDSLHSPRVVCPECDGSGRKKSCTSECGLRRRLPVSCKEQMCPWIMCQTCRGTGWVEKEGRSHDTNAKD